jgi:hypothetical protein
VDIALVISRIRPNAKWSLDDNRFETLRWFDESEEPTYKEITDAWTTISVDLEKKKIQGLRLIAYQKESDPLFFEYQRGDVEKQLWLDKVQEIKNRYPYTGNSQT